MSALKELLEVTGPVVFAIGPKKYELALNYGAIRRFETTTRPGEERKDNLGLPELSMAMLTGKPPKFSDAVKFFWATAKAKNPAWSLAMADELFDVAGANEYDALMDAIYRVILRDYADQAFVERLRKLLADAEKGEGEGDAGSEPRPLVPAADPTPAGS